MMEKKINMAFRRATSLTALGLPDQLAEDGINWMEMRRDCDKLRAHQQKEEQRQ